jgi:hypothetical protein
MIENMRDIIIKINECIDKNLKIYLIVKRCEN